MPQVINLIPLTLGVLLFFPDKYYSYFAISMFFYALYELIFGKQMEITTKSTFSERKLSVPFYWAVLFISLCYAVNYYVFGDCKLVDFITLFLYILNAIILDIKLISLSKKKKSAD
jgi:hypothetical protein